MEGCARRKSYFFDDLGIQFESSARARDRAILNIERKKKKKMKRNSNNGKENIFVLTFVLCDYETSHYRHYSSRGSLVFLAAVRVIARNHVGREPCRWKKGEEC